MLDARHHRDHFGIDYVGAIASAAGLAVHYYGAASSGVDLGIRLPGAAAPTMSPGIDARVQSTANALHRGYQWQFDGLTEVEFNQLAGRDFLYPRYLFLVCLPEYQREYATVQSDGIVLRQLCYYRSFSDEQPIDHPDHDAPRPVTVPLANVLKGRVLHDLIQPIAGGSASAE